MHVLKRTAGARRVLLIFALPLAVSAGCVLDRTGGLGCPEEGAISCSVYEVGHSFDAEENNYVFKGQCTLIEEKGKSELGDPMIKFEVAGEYERQSHEFSEAVLVEHDTFPLTGVKETQWSLAGTSAVDPWLYPDMPVGLASVAGDPNEFARGLCIETVPPPYRRIPFSRNVIVHMLSLQQLLSMRAAAADAADVAKTEPPPPPCPPHYLSSAPEMVMPRNNLAYKADVQGITVELRSQCGAANVDYQRSIYGLKFERFEPGGGWNEYRTFELPMHAYAYGGSQGFDTLPVSGPGLWRVRALQYVTLKGSGSSQYSEWGDWVQFRVGDPEMAMDQMQELATLVQLVDDDNAYRRRAAQSSRSYTSVPLRSVIGEELRSRIGAD